MKNFSFDIAGRSFEIRGLRGKIRLNIYLDEGSDGVLPSIELG